MAGIDLTPTKPPKAFAISTLAEMGEAWQELRDDYGCIGGMQRLIDTAGGTYDVLSVQLGGMDASVRLGDPKQIVVDVSGVYALTDAEVAARYTNG